MQSPMKLYQNLKNLDREIMTNLDALKTKYEMRQIPCEICGSEHSHMFQNYGRISEPGIYGKMPVTICHDCGFKMQNPRFEDGFYKNYYEAMYREIAFGAEKPSAEYIVQQKERGGKVLKFLKKHEKGVLSGKMLDHGCASGATMLSWKEEGWTVYGIDPHRPSVEEAKLMNLDVEIGTGEDLPFDDNHFDLILSLGSTEHSYNLDLTMREMNRVLKEQGKLIIRWRSNEIFGSPLEYFNHNHYRFFTRNSWTLCLKRYGFRVNLMSHERVEGWDSYEYIIATKAGNVIENLSNLLEGEKIDNVKNELEHIKEIRHEYYQRCLSFIELHAQHKDQPKKLIEHLRTDVDLKWGWLGGEPAEVVARSEKEARLYIAEYDSGKVK